MLRPALIGLASAVCAAACLSSPTRPTSDGAVAADAPVNDDAAGDARLIDARMGDAAVPDGAATDAPLADAFSSANTHSIQLVATDTHYLSAADDPTLDPVDALTIELWLRLDSVPATNQRFALVSKSDFDQPQNTFNLELRNVSGQLRVEFRMDGQSMSASGRDHIGWVWAGVTTGTWYHLAVSYSLTAATVADKFAIYLDGSPVTGLLTLANDDLDQLNNTAVPINVGALVPQSGSINFFDGALDDIRLWNDVRTPTEVADNYMSELSGSEPGLVAYWRLNNSFGDATSNGNDLAIVGTPDPQFVTDTPF